MGELATQLTSGASGAPRNDSQPRPSNSAARVSHLRTAEQLDVILERQWRELIDLQIARERAGVEPSGEGARGEISKSKYNLLDKITEIESIRESLFNSAERFKALVVAGRDQDIAFLHVFGRTAAEMEKQLTKEVSILYDLRAENSAYRSGQSINLDTGLLTLPFRVEDLVGATASKSAGVFLPLAMRSRIGRFGIRQLEEFLSTTRGWVNAASNWWKDTRLTPPLILNPALAGSRARYWAATPELPTLNFVLGQNLGSEGSRGFVLQRAYDAMTEAYAGRRYDDALRMLENIVTQLRRQELHESADDFLLEYAWRSLPQQKTRVLSFLQSQVSARGRGNNYIDAAIESVRGNYADAIQIVESLASTNSSQRIQLSLSRLYARDGHLDLALRCLRRGFSREEVDAVTLAMVRETIHYHRTNGNNAAAIKLCKDFLHEAPTDHVLHAELGNLLEITGNLKEAAHAFRRAMDLDPTNVSYQHEFATTILELGGVENEKEAIRLFVGITKLPGNAEQDMIARANAFTGLATVHLFRGHWGKATDALAAAKRELKSEGAREFLVGKIAMMSRTIENRIILQRGRR